ncbi:MAG TPA: polysaccharide biosynthesis C-terminal domain-containing protein, partial [Candidatus Methylomirabilis sp.]|nr:polysaccharide biosynthesis C-terminal domain-containing protein [Candidatus Methylomirabilis sp.]
SALAPRCIPLVYGNQFLGSVTPLGILPWVLLPIFLDFPIGSLLNATHRAHWKTTAMGATMVINAALNAVLVPAYGPVGASWAGVLSFWFLMAAGIAMTWRELPSVGWFAWLLGRALLVAGGTWYAILYVGAIMPFVLDVLFGAAMAGTLLLVTRLLTFDDVRLGYGWLQQRVKGADPVDEAQHPV